MTIDVDATRCRWGADTGIAAKDCRLLLDALDDERRKTVKAEYEANESRRVACWALHHEETMRQTLTLAQDRCRELVEENRRLREASPPVVPNVLAEEIAFFDAHLAEWLPTSRGRYALIKNSALLGIFHDPMTAFGWGAKHLGNVPVLIRLIAEEQPVISILAAASP